MLRSTRFQLSMGFLAVSLLAGAVSLLVGWHLLYRAVLNEAMTRIRLDLNAAREIYDSRVRTVALTLDVSALGVGLQSDLRTHDLPQLAQRLQRMSQHAQLDFAGMAAADGRVLCRLGPAAPADRSPVENPLVRFVLDHRRPVSGTVVMSQEVLAAEGPDLAARARIQSVSTPKAADTAEAVLTSGLTLAAATPVVHEGEFIGVLYGGTLVNRTSGIVDAVRDTVFQQETYRGRAIGGVTVFLGDTRISTNVQGPPGVRAVGTRAAREVRDRVLIDGERWTDRAIVVRDWHLTAYEPIKDIRGERVGMLALGVLEAKYDAVRRRFVAVFALVTAAGVAMAIGLGWKMGGRILRPVQDLIRAGTEVSRGNLSPQIGPVSQGDLGVLQRTFAEMLAALREHERRQKAESDIRLMQSERQASVGRLAAGVAHEINNPLTGVLTFTHLLLRRHDLAEDVRSDLQTIARETERVRKTVKGLLDFSRQTRLDPEPTDVNPLVASTLNLVENQALLKGVSLRFQAGEDLPARTLDRNQMQSALLNIVINAIDATEPRGQIVVETGFGLSDPRGGARGIEMAVSDTGPGIPPENLGRIFDPFFTTKEVGKGTGLGLSVSLGIVERHGGTIRVRSEVGRGSTFTIWLPLDATDGGHESSGG